MNNSKNQPPYKKPSQTPKQTIFSRIVNFIDKITGGADEMTDSEAKHFQENFYKLRFYRGVHDKKKWYIKKN